MRFIFADYFISLSSIPIEQFRNLQKMGIILLLSKNAKKNTKSQKNSFEMFRVEEAKQVRRHDLAHTLAEGCRLAIT